MGLISYLVIFMFANQIMRFNPLLGMLAYIAMFSYFGKARRRTANRSYQGYQRQQYSSNQGNQQSQDPRVVNAIDIEFSEEEIS